MSDANHETSSPAPKPRAPAPSRSALRGPGAVYEGARCGLQVLEWGAGRSESGHGYGTISCLPSRPGRHYTAMSNWFSLNMVVVASPSTFCGGKKPAKLSEAFPKSNRIPSVRRSSAPPSLR